MHPGGNPLGKFEVRSADWLKTMLILVLRNRLTLQVNLRWDVYIPQKNKKNLIYPKAIEELIASCIWFETSGLACKYS